MKNATIELPVPREEIGELENALNEVLNGFAVPDFDRRIGSRADVERLMRHFSDAYRASREDQEVLIQLDTAQVQVLRNALNAVLEGLEAGEFETRMGCTQLHARELVARLTKAQA
jgi:hypothetical protein